MKHFLNDQIVKDELTEGNYSYAVNLQMIG